MDTIFINFKNSKSSNPHRLLLYLTDKVNSKRSNIFVALSNLNIYYTWKNIKCYIRTMNLKYQLQREMKNLNYLMNHILYQIFRIILTLSYKKYGGKTINPSINTYVKKKKTESRLKLKQDIISRF